MPDNFYVYEHWRLDRDECFYVGKGQSWRAHRMSARNLHHKAIQAKLKSAGFEIEVRIIERDLSEGRAFELEVDRIKHWRDLGVKLANKTSGGEGVSNPAPEVRAKIAVSAKGNKRSLGVRRTEDQKAAISARMKGNKFWLGKSLTEEHKMNLSKAHTGRKISDDWRKKLSLSHKGLRPSSESRIKAAATMKNNVEARIKASAPGMILDSLGRVVAGPLKRSKRVICLNDGLEFVSASEASRFYGIDKATIAAVCSGNPKRHTAGGKVFRYVKELQEAA